MAILSGLQQLLEGNGVRYQVHPHPLAFTATETASKDGVPPSEMVKVVVLRSHDRFVMAALPASRRLDLDRFRETTGDRSLELASERELVRAFPACEPGAMPPFGELFGMPLWVDDALGREHETVFNAGNHRETVHLAYQDFIRVAKPQFGEFSRPRVATSH